VNGVRLNRGLPALSGGEAPVQPEIKLHLKPSTPPHRVPHIDAELIEHLSRIFQVHLAPAYDIRVYDTMLGHKQVLDYLKTAWEQQQKG
jgi:hypothetical protein